jgi:hypothetical protein
VATFSKQLLSGSTGGRFIKVASITQGSGTTIHATGTSSSILDEIWLYAVNSSASNVKLTVEFGGTTSPDDSLELTITAEAGLVLVVPGLVLAGTGAAARTVTAFAATANVINLSGYVNRIT